MADTKEAKEKKATKVKAESKFSKETYLRWYEMLVLFFKNYEEAGLTFSPHINCLVGPNGSGKTNLLDAIHYLALTKSAFSGTDLQNVKQGETYFMVKGRFAQEDQGKCCSGYV